jgi:hypothetical protein
MATSYQVKIFGRWRDIHLPWINLEVMADAIRRDGGYEEGTKLNENTMAVFLSMAKENWGDVFKTNMTPMNANGLPMALDFDCVVVLSLKHDALRVGVLWQIANQLPYTLKGDGSLKENWEETDGMIEITLLPGN